MTGCMERYLMKGVNEFVFVRVNEPVSVPGAVE